jgi:starvation-inducible DNA-binding protein
MSKVADSLIDLLADTFALYRVTHLYHWNVTGPNFPALHKMFNDQYDALFEEVDKIAEHVRALGEVIPPDFATRTELDATQRSAASWQDMVNDLIAGHAAVITTILFAQTVAEPEDDQATINLLAERMDYHLKQKWMLTATAG